MASSEDYDEIKSANVCAPNSGVTNEEIIKTLQDWDRRYGIRIYEITNQSLKVKFQSLPDDKLELAKEIESFCPDVSDFAEIVAHNLKEGRPVSEKNRELLEGLNYKDNNFRTKLFSRTLQQDKKLLLWWE